MFNHNGFLNYKLPHSWCAEEDADKLLLYNPNGHGAMIISFFNTLDTEKSLDEQICILAQRFINRHVINLHSSLILVNKGSKTLLYGTGTTADNWFIKLWIVAKRPKIVFATYQSERKNPEVRICDSIVDSFQFEKTGDGFV